MKRGDPGYDVVVTLLWMCSAVMAIPFAMAILDIIGRVLP